MKIGYLDIGLKALCLIPASILPQCMKKPLYRLAGYRIGPTASIGFGALLLCDKAEIGDNVRINPFSVIKVREFKIGDYGWIGMFTLCYGNGAVKMGKFASLGMKVMLNAEKDITIGDGSFVGQYSNLYTHSVSLSYTKGYPRKFKDIKIGKDVRISARCTVLPGVSIGDSSWVGPCSLINKDIPAGVFAGGVPAKVIKEDVRELFDKVDGDGLLRRLKEMVSDFIESNGIEAENDSEGVLVLNKYNTIIAIGDTIAIESGRKYILLTLKECALNRKDVSWFDFKNYKARVTSPLARKMYDFFWSHYGERIELV